MLQTWNMAEYKIWIVLGFFHVFFQTTSLNQEFSVLVSAYNRPKYDYLGDFK